MTEIVPRPSPHGHCIFCEDIRFEVNAKETYVGVFGSGELFILGRQLPTNIGKFAIKTYYCQRRTDVVAPLAIEILMPGDSDDGPSARVDIDLQEVLENLPEATDIEDPFLTIQSVFIFNPLEIKTEGLITVRAVRDGKSYRLGRLRVKVNPTPAAPAQPPAEEAAN